MSFYLNAAFFMLANEIPEIKAPPEDFGTWRRIKPVPFQTSFKEQHLDIPIEFAHRLQALRHKNNAFKRFADEFVTQSAQAFSDFRDVFNEYNVFLETYKRQRAVSVDVFESGIVRILGPMQAGPMGRMGWWVELRPVAPGAQQGLRSSETPVKWDWPPEVLGVSTRTPRTTLDVGAAASTPCAIRSCVNRSTKRNQQPTNNIQSQPKISTIFKRSEASAEPESASVKPESKPFVFSEPGSDYSINSNLPVVVTAATPDGFKQFEKDTWQFAKSRLRCKQFIADSVCGSAFQTKSACGTETPFGLRLISVVCTECGFRPRLRDACRNSGIEALIDLSVESAKLEDHLRAHYNRKQRKKAVSFIQPIAHKKRLIETVESSSEEEVEDIDSEKKEKMSGSTMNLVELTKFVQDHSKRVDEFMKTINTQMELMREQNIQLKQQMERNETLQREVEELRKQLQTQNQQPQHQQQPQQQPPKPTRSVSRAARTASRGRTDAPINSHATGPIYRPKNLNRTQTFNQSFKAAPSYKEIAAMSIRSDFNAPARDGPPRVRAESIKLCFVSLRFLKKEAKMNGPMKATRAIFRETFELPYIEDISPLGRGFSIAEIFFDGRHEADIRQKLAAKEILLADFNPLDTPPHQIDANEETMRERMCARRAGVYRRARFALVKQAALEGCDMAMQARIRELAAPQKGTQSASNMEQ
ncbi:hypothetical protein HDU81_008900 [Chytriomyces hyalinus]|nr:hypothetical protein HDU81_008900 [Chytriomyces hyalinus]